MARNAAPPVLLSALLLSALLAPARAEEPAQRRAFIERTHVIAPHTVAGFRLMETRYDPGHKLAGVRLRYLRTADDPVTLDVFVYPAGRKDQAKAVREEVIRFRQDLDTARAIGLYRTVDIGPDEAFALDPDSDTGPALTDSLETRIARAAAVSATVGNRNRIALVDNESGRSLQSLGYVFHRQLNHVKVRLTQPADVMSADAFTAFADHAVRSLVLAIEALNVGACGDRTVYVDPDAEHEDAILHMVRDTSRLMEENCVPSAEQGDLAGKSRGAKVIHIDFEPGDWEDSA